MKWKRGAGRGDVEDMRGGGGFGGRGVPIGVGGGGAGLLLLLLVVLLTGGLPGGGGDGGPLDPLPTVASPQAQPGEPQTSDDQTEFVYFVTNDVQNAWEDIFRRRRAVPAHDAPALHRPGQHRLRPRLVLAEPRRERKVVTVLFADLVVGFTALRPTRSRGRRRRASALPRASPASRTTAIPPPGTPSAASFRQTA